MKPKIFNLIILFFMANIIFAQLKHNLPIQQLPSNLNNELENSFSIFELNRLNINHGFSMSSIYSDGQNISIAGYTNSIYYLFNENLIFNSNITLYKENSPIHMNNLKMNQLNIGYELGLKYKPSKNSFIELNIQSLPFYQNQYKNNRLFY